MYNILHIRDTGDLLGAENVILEIAKHSEKYGFNAIIGVLEGGSTKLIDHAKKYNLKSILIPCKGKIDLSTLKHIKNIINEFNIDLVHAHGYKEDFYTLFSRQTPIIATNHLWKRTTFALKVYAYLDSLLMRKFNKVVAVSEPIYNDMLKSGIPEEILLTIPNGIDMSRFANKITSKHKQQLKSEFNIVNHALVIGMISSLSREKGHAEALKSFSKVLVKYETVHLLIVGSGEEESELRKLISQLGIADNVSIVGRREDIPAIHKLIDIFLLYSSIEGLPMALLEAMASGLAVVATDVGDVKTVVSPDVTGKLVNYGDADQLENALIQLINNDDLRNKYGNAAKKRMGDTFSSESMTEKYSELYKSLLQ